MIAPGSDASQLESQILALTSDFEGLAAAIDAHGDPDEAFCLATLLWAVLRTATDANGALRARKAELVWLADPTDMVQLAERLSRSGHPIKKSRASQLLSTARELRRTADGNEE